TVCVVGKMRDLILQLSKSSIYSTKPGGGCKTLLCSYKSWYQGCVFILSNLIGSFTMINNVKCSRVVIKQLFRLFSYLTKQFVLLLV
ncbi:hypothetical protein LIN35_26360, partial [Klebsiella pneumoniae]|nr:hypothetical protein [Klebsiella pneumoniae]